MAAYLLRRLLLAAGLLAVVSYATFIAVATQFSATCSSRYTPNTPFPPLASNVRQASVLYWEWVKGVPSGRSFGNVCGAPVTQDLGQALSHTGALLAMTLVMVLALSLLFGVLAAARAGSGLDLAFRGFSYAAWAIPPFLLALVVQSVLVWLRSHAGFRLFPASGWPGSCGSAFFTCSAHQPLTFHYVGAVLRFLVVPSLALAVAFVGLHSRYLRSALLVALAAPYTTTARAKGLSEQRVVLRHALRNSLGTFTSVLLLDFGAVLGAALAVDFVFRLEGVGLLFLGEIGATGSQSGDGPKFLDPYAVQALLSVIAVMVAASSLLAELAVLWLDPRARPA